MPVTIESQGRLLKNSVWTYTQQRTLNSGGSRKKITEFSARSRKNLNDLSQRLDRKKIGKGRVTFITLTYGDDFPSWARSKENLRAFFERWRRRYSGLSVLWRIESQERGAPHFHLIVFNAPWIPWKELRKMWRQVVRGSRIEDKTAGTADVRRVKSADGVISYVSKYIAKMDGACSVEDCRCHDLRPPPAAALTSLVSITKTHGNTQHVRARSWYAEYADAMGIRSFSESCQADFVNRHNQTFTFTSPIEPPTMGRHWGIYNRAEMPYAEKNVFVLPFGSWIYALRDRAKEIWPGMDKDKDGKPVEFARPGFTLYLGEKDSAYCWCEWIMNTVDRWAAWQRARNKDPWEERTVHEAIQNDRFDTEQKGRRLYAQRLAARREAEDRKYRPWETEAGRKDRLNSTPSENADWDDYISAIRKLRREQSR